MCWFQDTSVPTHSLSSAGEIFSVSCHLVTNSFSLFWSQVGTSSLQGSALNPHPPDKVYFQSTLQFPLSINHNFNQMNIWVIVYDRLHEVSKLLLFSQYQCLPHRRFLINIWWSERINKSLGPSNVNHQHLFFSRAIQTLQINLIE